MKPIEFAEANCTYAENQPEYLPLPAMKEPDGTVLTQWKLGWRERIGVLLTGKIWLWVMTFNRPLQPLILTTENPFKAKRIEEKPE